MATVGLHFKSSFILFYSNTQNIQTKDLKKTVLFPWGKTHSFT